MLSTSFRALAAVVGAVLCYAALFLYENEEGYVQNRLEGWWAKLDDARANSMSNETLFMQRIAILTGHGLDRVFGARLVSIQAIGVSFCYSIASIFISILLIRPAAEASEDLAYCAFGVALFAICGSLPTFSRSRMARLAPAGLVLVVLCDFLIHEATQDASLDALVGNWIWVACFAVCTLISDVLLVALTRQLLRWGEKQRSATRIVTTVAANLLLAVIVVWVPWKFFLVYRSTEWGKAAMAALALAASNNVVAMCLAAYVGICVGMLGHRLFWPILERPLYAACRFGLVRRKKLLGAAGVTLLAAAIPGVAELLKQFAEVLGR